MYEVGHTSSTRLLTPRSNTEKHNLSSWYLFNKHAAGHKLPVTCLIGVCLSVEDCLCNCVWCVWVCGDGERSESSADEERSLLLQKCLYNEPTWCKQDPGQEEKLPVMVSKCNQLSRQPSLTLWSCSIWHWNRRRLWVDFPKKSWVESANFLRARSFDFQVNLELALNGRFESWWQSCGLESQDRLRSRHRHVRVIHAW